MSTPFDDIYDRFLPKISEYAFNKLSEDELKEIIEPYLLSSIVKFKKCKKLANRDKVLKIFNEELTDEEQEILASLMVADYLSPKLITADLVEQRISTNDFKIYSQANHIKEIKSLRDSMASEARAKITDYSYSERKVDEFL